MLSMDDIKYIKRLYESEGVSIREIMLMCGKVTKNKRQPPYTIPK